MNILQINKFFRVVGGVDKYFLNVSNILKEKKHEIAYFSMRHKHNIYSDWNKYFVSNLDIDKKNILNILKVVERIFYSPEARKCISTLLNDFSPDIAHIHSIFHYISPSILIELKKRNVPIVQSLGDYHLISPNYHLFHDGKICEITKPKNYYKAIFHRCVKSSFVPTIVEVMEKYFQLIAGWETNLIDIFLPRSQFLKEKLIEYGISPNKIIHLPHFVDVKKYKYAKQRGNYILYFGRLSEEKGLAFLLEVMKELPSIQLKIAGTGPEEFNLRSKSRTLRLHNVEFIGFKTDHQLYSAIANSRFTILPSIWFEVFGLSILESFVIGKPVIGSRIGGIPEVIKDGYNGFLFEPGEKLECIIKIKKLWDNPSLCASLGKNARDFVVKNFNSKSHYNKLMFIYNKAIQMHR